MTKTDNRVRATAVAAVSPKQTSHKQTSHKQTKTAQREARMMLKGLAEVKHVHAIDPERDAKLVREFADRCGDTRYGQSWMYVTQAADTRNQGGSPYGYLFAAQDRMAVIGLFARPHSAGGRELHFHIVSPVGNWTREKMTSLCQELQDLSGTAVYIKKATDKQREDWKSSARFGTAERLPWHEEAPYEDDTFGEVILSLDHTVAALRPEAGDNELRRKYRLFERDFGSRIERVAYDPATMREEALAVVNGFFADKDSSLSTPENYLNMIEAMPAGVNGRDYFATLYRVNKRPVALFLADRIAPAAVGVYGNLTATKEKEFAYLSEYFQMREFRHMLEAGIHTANLGGSETSSLQRFKSKFRPSEKETNPWVLFE